MKQKIYLIFLLVYCCLNVTANAHESAITSLLGWTEERAQIKSNGVLASYGNSLIVEQSDKDLSEESFLFSAALSKTVTDEIGVNLDLDYSERNIDLAIDDYHLNYDIEYRLPSISASYRDYSLLINTEGLGIGLSLWGGRIELQPETTHHSLFLDLSSVAIDDLASERFIFDGSNDYAFWNLRLKSRLGNFNVSIHEDSIYELNGSYLYDTNQFVIEYESYDPFKSNLNLNDGTYRYGSLAWRNSGSRYQYTYRWDEWGVSYMENSYRLESDGSATLNDVHGVDSVIAGATWLYGAVLDVHAKGLKIDRLWNRGRWKHNWSINVNYMEPSYSLRTYKHLLLLPVPQLDDEEFSEIEYIWSSQLSWYSEYKLSNISIGFKVDQILPLEVKETTKVLAGGGSGSDSGGGSSSGSTATGNESSHSGYAFSITTKYQF